MIQHFPGTVLHSKNENFILKREISLSRKCLSLALVASALGFAQDSYASHFRGGDAWASITANGVVTMTARTRWREDVAHTQPFPFAGIDPARFGLTNFTCVNGTSRAFSPAAGMRIVRVSDGATVYTWAANSFSLSQTTTIQDVGHEHAVYDERTQVMMIPIGGGSATNQINTPLNLPFGTYDIIFNDYSRIAGIQNIEPGEACGTNASGYSLRVRVIWNGTAMSGPSLASEFNGTLARGFEYSQNLNVSHPEGLSMIYRFVTGASYPTYGPVNNITGISLDGTTGNMVISALNTNSMLENAQGEPAGDYTFKVQIEDSRGFISERDGLLDAINSTNVPPVLDAIGNRTIEAGQTISFTVRATDATSGDRLTLRASGLPAGATFVATADQPSPATGTFTWTPSPAQVGNFGINFDVVDHGTHALNHTDALSGNENIVITVRAANRSPVLEEVANQRVGADPLMITAFVNQTLTFDAYASDANAADVLTYSLPILRDPTNNNRAGDATVGFSVANTTDAFGRRIGRYSWTPAAAHVGVWQATVRVDDGQGGTAETIVYVSVGTFTNQSPVFSSAPPSEVFGSTGTTITFNMTATDPNGGQTVTLRSTGRPAGSTFNDNVSGNPVTGTFSWTPAANQSGTFTILWQATDSATPSITETVQTVITVAQSGGVPVIADLSPNEGPISGGTSVTLRGSGFSGSVSVTIGGNAVSNLAIIDSGTLAFETPASAIVGAANVVVTTANGTATLVGGFLYRDLCPNESPDDVDGDGICAGAAFFPPMSAANDNCPAVSNANQANLDGDAQGDVCDNDDDNDGAADAADNCPILANADQANLDGDAQGDVCDNDDDNDGSADATDNCPRDANADQANLDGDAQGDACDNDDDNDGDADAVDNCPILANADQANLDGDAQGDACDNDDDNDGSADATDNCPRDANTDQANNDGDAQGDACDNDDDNDGFDDAADNCAMIANSDQANNDGDAEGDVCDSDDDNDNIGDAIDNCQLTSNADQANNDGDSEGDVCDNDDDNDGFADTADNCAFVFNADQANLDGDAEGDACDNDDDNDGAADAVDNCAVIANSDQANNDGDANGDACDTDDDNDAVGDAIDNCQFASNADQANNDGDAEGDLCDNDDDNDGTGDTTDNCPITANTDQANRDGDALGDVCDDSDNDGAFDSIDNCAVVYNPDQVDEDSDTLGNLCDNCARIANTDQADTDGDGTGNVCDQNPTVPTPSNNGAGTAQPGQTSVITTGNGAATITLPPGFTGPTPTTVTISGQSMAPDFRVMTTSGTGGVAISAYDVTIGNFDPYYPPNGEVATVMFEIPYLLFQTQVDNHTIAIAVREPNGSLIMIPNCLASPPNPNMSADGRCTSTEVYTRPFGQQAVRVSTQAFHFSEYLLLDVTPPFISAPAGVSVEATSTSGATASYDVTATDLSDGDTNVTCAPLSGSTFALGATTVTCNSIDRDNNASSTSFTVTVTDTTDPVLSLIDASAEANSVYGVVVNYTATASDISAGELAPTCFPASGSVFALGDTVVYCSVEDGHGNNADGTLIVTVVDTIAPAVTVPANITAEAVNASGAAVSFTASAVDISAGDVATTCAPASGSIFPIGATEVVCSANDGHGNTGAGSFTVEVRDTTAPVVTVPANIAVIANTAAGRVVSFTTSANDLVNGSVAVSCTPASGSVFAPGATVVRCHATDAAGNRSADQTFTVTVTISWSGVLQPVNANGSSVFKRGRIVPVKFNVTGASSAITSGVFRLYYAQVSSGVIGEINEAESTSVGNVDNIFKHTGGGTYHYNLSTDDMPQGTYVMRIDLGDGVIHDTYFALRN